MRFLDSAMLRIASFGMTLLYCVASLRLPRKLAVGLTGLAMTHWYWVVRIANTVAVRATAKL